ncbi:MAG TPA: NAD(P)H-dependent oxidoreductase subunit E [Elusimicrobiales bacterium]|nr:NAD(P)H-dependent oxidoreductase subunit E [Elusimicrobiales bacterium]
MKTPAHSPDAAAVARRHGNDRAALIPALQELSAKGGLTGPVLAEVAQALGVPEAEVYGTATFYAFLGAGKKARCVVRLCGTLSCELAGKKAVAAALERALGIKFGQTDKKGDFALEWTSCLGMCDKGPALLANGELYQSLTPKKVPAVIAACRRALAAGRKK